VVTALPNTSDLLFDPPVLVGGSNVELRSLGAAADFLRQYNGARRPFMQAGVLRCVEAATSAAERRDAAKAFLFWAGGEGLLSGETSQPFNAALKSL
jgi:hypothetical protein